MKKSIFWFMSVLCVTMLLSSCLIFPVTHKVILDQQSPVDQNVTVIFKNDTENGYFALKEWNGIGIRDTVNNKRAIKSNDTIVITVPSGKTSFIFDVRYTFTHRNALGNYQTSTTHFFEDVELQYLFEPGNEYEVKGFSKSIAFGFKGIEFYLYLYDTTKKSVLLKEWMIGKKN